MSILQEKVAVFFHFLFMWSKVLMIKRKYTPLLRLMEHLFVEKMVVEWLRNTIVKVMLTYALGL